MVGLQISAIKSGSLFEQLGIEDGETITEVNGIPIDGPEQSPKILQKFSEGGPLIVDVRGKDGGSRTLTLEPSAE
jgi:S1-C subfamily serine protease